jgi:hypothetical protein
MISFYYMARSQYEIQAQKELEKEGYLVDYKIRPRFPMRNYNVDFLGLFDLLAIKPDGSEKKLRCIAIKGLAGNRHLIIREIEAIPFPEGVQKEIWWIKTKKGKKYWEKRILN